MSFLQLASYLCKLDEKILPLGNKRATTVMATRDLSASPEDEGHSNKMVNEQVAASSTTDCKFHNDFICADGIEIRDTWLPDGAFFHVLLFLNGGILTHDDHAISSLFPPFFQSLVYVSKSFHASALRYLHQIPLTIDCNPSLQTLKRLAWATSTRSEEEKTGIMNRRCKDKNEFKNRVKIGDCRFYTNSSDASLNVYRHILQTCDIRQMESFTLWGMWVNHITMFRAIHAGFPSDIFQRSQSRLRSSPGPGTEIDMTPLDFQIFFAEYAPHCTQQLKRMNLSFWVGEWHLPILTNFSDSLEELILCIKTFLPDPASSSEHDRNLEDLTEAIGRLKKLKRLKISFNWNCKFDIVSESLEEIDMVDSFRGSCLGKCICPNLKQLLKNERSIAVAAGSSLETSCTGSGNNSTDTGTLSDSFDPNAEL